MTQNSGHTIDLGVQGHLDHSSLGKTAYKSTVNMSMHMYNLWQFRNPTSTLQLIEQILDNFINNNKFSSKQYLSKYTFFSQKVPLVFPFVTNLPFITQMKTCQ